jgi:HEAT repeat protein
MAGKRLTSRRAFLVAVLIPLLPASAAPPVGETPLPTSVPATRGADQQRIEDYLMLIQGPNLPLAARRTGARELLRLGWPQTVSRLTGVLTSDNKPARLAVALALADVPDPDQAYIEPLMALLADSDAEMRHAAAAALAGYRDNGVVARLREMMLDESRPAVLRLAAVEALGAINKRAAVAALVEAVAIPDVTIAQPALEALERSTAMTFGGDAARALAWWELSKEEPLPEWQQGQIDRLLHRSRELEQDARDLEVRLVESYRADYIRTPEAERGPLLQTYLKDSSTLVRLLGLELVQRQLGEGKPLPADAAGPVRELTRELLCDADPVVRVAAVQTVARFRDMADAERFLQALATERKPNVCQALVNGLGYVGNGDACQTLLNIVRTPENPARAEAVAALGRQAERGVLGPVERGDVADELLKLFEQTSPAQPLLRERVLWAMAQIADPGFANVFAQALHEREAPLVRQAAARGVTAVKEQIDSLIPVTRDPDLTVRRAAVEALADCANTDEHLGALWERLAPGSEADPTIRQVAWRAAVKLLAGRSVAEAERWMGRLPDGDERDARTDELLAALEASLAQVPEGLGELGRVWARVAAQRAAQNKTEPAIAAYVSAVRDLRAGQLPEAAEAAQGLVRLSLLNARYDEAIATALTNGGPALDGAALWAAIRPDIVQRLNPEYAEQVVQMLSALRQHPPAQFSAEVSTEISAILARAEALRKPAGTTSAPTSQITRENRDLAQQPPRP